MAHLNANNILNLKNSFRMLNYVNENYNRDVTYFPSH